MYKKNSIDSCPMWSALIPLVRTPYGFEFETLLRKPHRKNKNTNLIKLWRIDLYLSPSMLKMIDVGHSHFRSIGLAMDLLQPLKPPWFSHFSGKVGKSE